MTDLSKLQEWVDIHNPDALMVDGMDEAVIGMAIRCGCPSLLIYDVDKCVEILVKRDGMTEEEASEYFYFNTVGAWMGNNTPLFLLKYEP